MKRTLLALSIIAALGLNSLGAKAEPSKNFDSDFKNCKTEFCKKVKAESDRISKELNLTETQKTQAKHLRESARSTIQPLFQQMRTERQKLRELRQSNASADTISIQKEKLKALHLQLQTLRKDHMQKFEAILTPDQKAKFEKVIAEKKAKMEEFKKSNPNMKN